MNRKSNSNFARLIVAFLIANWLSLSGVSSTTSFPQITTATRKGTRLGYRLVAQLDPFTRNFEIQQSLQVIAARLKKLGIESAVVRRSEKTGEHIEVLLPPVADLRRIKEVLAYYGIPQMRPVKNTDRRCEYTSKAQAEKAAAQSNTPAYEILKSSDPNDSKWFIVEKEAILTGGDFQSAKIAELPYGVGIDFTLTPAAAERMSAWSGKHIGDCLAIVINGEVLSAPMIQSRLHKEGQIFGQFTKLAVESLVIAIESGELPYRLELVSEKAIQK